MHVSNHIEFFICLDSASNRVSKRLDRSLGAVHGLGVSDYRVMHQLDVAPGKVLSRIELAESVGLTASGITRLLNPMEKIGLVEKRQNDRDARVSLVSLSEIGKQRLSEARESFLAVMETSLSKLSQQEKASLIELLEKIA